MTESQELAVVEHSIVLSPQLTDDDLANIRDVLTGASEYEIPDADTSAIAEEQLNKLLFAESEEELLAEVPTWSSKDVVGKAFRIFPAGRLWPSKYVSRSGRKGAFLSVQATEAESGEMGVFNSSSPRIVGKLVWYAKHSQLPANFQVVKIGETSNGFDLLDIDRIDG
ncbi:MAG: hypothetical protein ACRDNM_06215 [Gaiellaceae bacterium]